MYFFELSYFCVLDGTYSLFAVLKLTEGSVVLSLCCRQWGQNTVTFYNALPLYMSSLTFVECVESNRSRVAACAEKLVFC